MNRLAFDTEGHLVALRGREVLRVAADGSIQVLGIPPGPPDEHTLGLRDLWGLALADDGTWLTTDPSRRQVLAIETDGRSRVVHQSAAPWFPTGVATQGTRILLLEHGLAGDSNLGPRVTCLDDGEAPRVLGQVSDPHSPTR